MSKESNKTVSEKLEELYDMAVKQEIVGDAVRVVELIIDTHRIKQ